MSKKLLFIVLATLALAGCQDDKAPAASTPSEPVAASPDASVTETKQVPVPTQQKPAIIPTGNAVAVTKPAKSNIAQSMQAALQQAGAGVKAKATAVIADKPAIAKPAVAKQLTTKPAAAVKQTVAKKAVAAVTRAAPVSKPAIATKVAPKAATKAAPTAVAAVAPVALVMAGDAAKGQSLARKCKTCHNFTARKKVGPGLKAVFGRQAGAMPDMKYSPALAAGSWVWNEKNLALWICNSKKAVKTLSGNPSARTKMGPQRICDASKQADLIAFLKTL